MIIQQTKKDGIRDFLSASIIVLDLAIRKAESHKDEWTIPRAGSLRKIKDQIAGLLRYEVILDQKNESEKTGGIDEK